MAAAIKALNTRIRANPVTDYLCSTRESSFDPLRSQANDDGIGRAQRLRKLIELQISGGQPQTSAFPLRRISGTMTMALIGYSSVFMRYAMAVTPKNYLLFGCHIVNFSAQCTQGYRYLNYWNFGGREKVLEEQARQGARKAEGAVSEGIKEVLREK
ncbi:MAG: hypothetical protein Q9165_007554 [Trypethelium subeluteriae]